MGISPAAHFFLISIISFMYIWVLPIRFPICISIIISYQIFQIFSITYIWYFFRWKDIEKICINMKCNILSGPLYSSDIFVGSNKYSIIWMDSPWSCLLFPYLSLKYLARSNGDIHHISIVDLIICWASVDILGLIFDTMAQHQWLHGFFP